MLSPPYVGNLAGKGTVISLARINILTYNHVIEIMSPQVHELYITTHLRCVLQLSVKLMHLHHIHRIEFSIFVMLARMDITVTLATSSKLPPTVSFDTQHAEGDCT